MRSCVNFTSLAVKGWPSCHFTPRLSLMTYSSPFFWMPPFFADGTSVARLGLNCACSSTLHRLSKMPKCTPWSTSMCGRTGLKTVGSCDSATTTCPPFLMLSAASTTLRSSRGPQATECRPAREHDGARAGFGRSSCVLWRGYHRGFPPGGTMLAAVGRVKEASLVLGPLTLPSPPEGRGVEESGVEGLAALVAVPEADQVAFALRLLSVAERCPTVGKEPVVQILELALLDGELDPAPRRVQDGAHRSDGVVANVVERLILELLGIRHEALVVAATEPAPRPLEDGLPRDLRVVGSVLGLAVPGHRLVQPREKRGICALELLVRRHQAHEAAHPAFHRGVDAEQADQLGRRAQPGGVSVELQIQVRHRPAHAVGQSAARVAHVVDHETVPLLRDQPAEQRAEQPGQGLVLVCRVALHRHTIDHGEPDAVAKLPPHRRHHLATVGELKLGGREKESG